MSKKLSTTNWFTEKFEKTIIDTIDNICYSENEFYEDSVSKVIRVCAGIYAHQFVTISNYDEERKSSELHALHRILKDLVIIYYNDKNISMTKVMAVFEEMINTTHNGTFDEFTLPRKLNRIGVTLNQINRMIKFIHKYSHYRDLAINELKNSIDM